MNQIYFSMNHNIIMTIYRYEVLKNVESENAKRPFLHLNSHKIIWNSTSSFLLNDASRYRWFVLGLLPPEELAVNRSVSKRSLELFKRIKLDFFGRYMIMDETWIHQYTHKSNQQSVEWKAVGEIRPK